MQRNAHPHERALTRQPGGAHAATLHVAGREQGIEQPANDLLGSTGVGFDGVGVEVYIGVITGLNQPTLESLIASLRPKRLMDYVKQACNDEEKKLVDSNESWFIDLKKEMILEIKGEDESDGDGQPASEAAKQ